MGSEFSKTKERVSGVWWDRVRRYLDARGAGWGVIVRIGWEAAVFCMEMWRGVVGVMAKASCCGFGAVGCLMELGLEEESQGENGRSDPW